MCPGSGAWGSDKLNICVGKIINSLFNTNDDYYLTATYYHSDTSDAIGRQRIDGVNTFVNEQGNIEFNGIELEGHWDLNKQWYLQGSYSYQENEDNMGNKGVMLASDNMLKLGLAYQSPSGYNLGLWYNYFGDLTRLQSSNSNIHVVNPEANAVNLLSLNLSKNMGEVLSSQQWDKLELSVQANNLLGEDLMFAELGRRIVNTFPQSQGSDFIATLKVSF